MHEPNGSGTIELSNGAVYGEPLKHLTLIGTLASNVVNISSANLAIGAGTVTATGNYNLDDKTIKGEARGAAIDLGRIAWLHQRNFDVAGQLTASVSGSGNIDKPLFDAQATLSDLALGGQKVGNLSSWPTPSKARSTIKSPRDCKAPILAVQGHTTLSGDYPTHAQASFSQFNIGAILELAHLESIKGESSLAGTITVDGPLSDTSKLRGEAILQQLAVTVAGVHLESPGGAHVTLANSRIHLDPLHVTGESTDLRAQGQLNLRARANSILPPTAPSTSSLPRRSTPISPPAAPPPSKSRPTAPSIIQPCRPHRF